MTKRCQMKHNIFSENCHRDDATIYCLGCFAKSGGREKAKTNKFVTTMFFTNKDVKHMAVGGRDFSFIANYRLHFFKMSSALFEGSSCAVDLYNILWSFSRMEIFVTS